MDPISFETHPERYRHWNLEVDGAVARLTLDVREDEPLGEGYVLKLNSYDLGVDIELADAVRRLRFEHPEVKAVVVGSGKDRVFCAGANIGMLASAAHGFKVNFCKFTNETRISIEDASARSGIRFLAALNGATAGGGYELALACDEILLVEDGSSTVSLPEVPLLAVLPGTGGLTRLVDKRMVRRDRADVFCTLAEGIKGKRAQKWRLVDHVAPRSKFDALIDDRVAALVASEREGPERQGPGIELTPLTPELEPDAWTYRYVTVTIDRAGRTALLKLRGPDGDQPATAAAIREAGADLWSLRCFRELDDALLRLRFCEPEIGLLLIKTTGDSSAVVAADHALCANRDDWFAAEVIGLLGEVLRRLDHTARSIFALVEPGSCFAGSLLELALAADRTYALDDPDQPVSVTLSTLNSGGLPMLQGLSRIEAHLMGEPDQAAELLDQARGAAKADEPPSFDPEEAEEAGLVTICADDIDYEDEVRIAVEERVSLSPDALTGMEASLRFPGPENCDTKIFGRLTAWQNWIFQRPNAVGERGALSVYGRPERPSFDWRRT